MLSIFALSNIGVLLMESARADAPAPAVTTITPVTKPTTLASVVEPPSTAASDPAQPQDGAAHPHGLATRRDLAVVTLSLEAAVDEDGDIRLWKRKVRVTIGPIVGGPRSSFWRDAVKKGCGGELLRIEKGVVLGRLSASCGTPPAISVEGAAARLRRGSIGWRLGAASAPRSAEFGLVLDDKAYTSPTQSARGVGEQGPIGMQLFGEVDEHAWAEGIDELSGMVTPSGAFDPPLHFTLG